jgi:hypothetical protein
MKRTRKRSHVPVKVEGAPTTEELSQLLDDLHAIADTHPELYYRVYELIGWLLLPDGFIWQQQESREWMRHKVARHHLENRKKWDTGGGSKDGTFQSTADDLRDHPAAASPDRIEAAYKTGERKLPRELRRVSPERQRRRKEAD